MTELSLPEVRKFLMRAFLKTYSELPVEQKEVEDTTGRLEEGKYTVYFDPYRAKWTPSKREAILGFVIKDITDYMRTTYK